MNFTMFDSKLYCIFLSILNYFYEPIDTTILCHNTFKLHVSYDMLIISSMIID